jgi:hypothetical protein
LSKHQFSSKNGIGIAMTQARYPDQIMEYIDLLNDAHERSGLSLREAAQASDLDPTYIHYILKGARRPQRDVIIALGFTYRLERIEVDEILLLAGLPPLGRSALREFRQKTRYSPTPKRTRKLNTPLGTQR